MTPEAGGRHCAACQETVVDFTKQTDAEILAFLRAYPSVTCGRFTKSQLNRQLFGAVAEPPRSRWSKWLMAAVALLGISELLATSAAAQKLNPDAENIPHPNGSRVAVLAEEDELAVASRTSVEAAAPAAPSAGAAVTFSGTVHNRWGKPLAGAVVVLRQPSDIAAEETARVITNAFGHFLITTDVRNVSDVSFLLVTYRRHRSKTTTASIGQRRYHFFLRKRFHRGLFRRRIISGKFR